jgi:hypothetical protein
MKRRKTMSDTPKPQAQPSAGEEILPIATFKNSLKQWQARWQAQRPATAVDTDVVKTFKVRPRRARKAVRPH